MLNSRSISHVERPDLLTKLTYPKKKIHFIHDIIILNVNMKLNYTVTDSFLRRSCGSFKFIFKLFLCRDYVS